MKIDFNHIILNIKNKKYNCIGSGSGRTVFDLQNGYVVKVAKNKKGLAQNEAEYKIYSSIISMTSRSMNCHSMNLNSMNDSSKKAYMMNTCSMDTHLNLFAGIPAASADFRLLIMEKAEKINHISYVWDYLNVKSKKEFLELKELKDLSDKHNLLLSDLCRSTSWGIISGRPVIIDYGYTKEVMKKYYALFK